MVGHHAVVFHGGVCAGVAGVNGVTGVNDVTQQTIQFPVLVFFGKKKKKRKKIC